MRQIILDTETTGLEPSEGHRIIEIGCVELLNRRLTGNHYHQYLNPNREIEASAIEVHGITNEFVADKPHFSEVAAEFVEFVDGAELIIHNAPFDVGFINHELVLLGEHWGKIEDRCAVLDTLKLARRMHPGQRNSLDALCKRYDVDSSQRTLHGALLDSEILADVYLAMTGGQTSLLLATEEHDEEGSNRAVMANFDQQRPPVKIINATEAEQAAHDIYLQLIENQHGEACVWRAILGQRSEI